LPISLLYKNQTGNSNSLSCNDANMMSACEKGDVETVCKYLSKMEKGPVNGLLMSQNINQYFLTAIENKCASVARIILKYNPPNGLSRLDPSYMGNLPLTKACKLGAHDCA
jgi:hypothetical protein